MALVAALLIAAAVRLQRTPRSHADRAARLDMARLLLLVLIGQAGVLLRSRFVEFSPAFWTCTALLLPVVGGTAWLIARLVRTYRNRD